MLISLDWSVYFREIHQGKGTSRGEDDDRRLSDFESLTHDSFFILDSMILPPVLLPNQFLLAVYFVRVVKN